MEEGSKIQCSQFGSFTIKSSRAFLEHQTKDYSLKTTPLPTTQAFNSHNAHVLVLTESTSKHTAVVDSVLLGTLTHLLQGYICGQVFTNLTRSIQLLKNK